MGTIDKRQAKQLARSSKQITRYAKETDYSNYTHVEDLDVTYEQMVEDLPHNARLWFAEQVSPILLRISYRGCYFDCVLPTPKEEEVSC